MTRMREGIFARPYEHGLGLVTGKDTGPAGAWVVLILVLGPEHSPASPASSATPDRSRPHEQGIAAKMPYLNQHGLSGWEKPWPW